MTATKLRRCRTPQCDGHPTARGAAYCEPCRERKTAARATERKGRTLAMRQALEDRGSGVLRCAICDRRICDHALGEFCLMPKGVA